MARTNRTSESRKNWAKARGSFKLYRALGQIRWLHTRKSFSKGRKDKESIAHVLSFTINFYQLLSYTRHVDIISGMNEPVHRAYCRGTRVAFTHGQNTSPVMCQLHDICSTWYCSEPGFCVGRVGDGLRTKSHNLQLAINR